MIVSNPTASSTLTHTPIVPLLSTNTDNQPKIASQLTQNSINSLQNERQKRKTRVDNMATSVLHTRVSKPLLTLVRLHVINKDGTFFFFLFFLDN